MSRSIRKNYFLPCACCQPEKKDKKRRHKIFRQKEKQKINSSNLEEYVITYQKEITNPWNMGKDGKRYYSQNDLLVSIKKMTKSFYKNKNERITNERKMFYRLVGK